MNLIESLTAIQRANRPQYLSLLKDGHYPSETLSGTEFVDRIGTIAAFIRKSHKQVRRVGLVYPAGGYLLAPVMLGCIVAGCVVVPMKVPKSQRKNDRASRVLVEAKLDLVITPVDFANIFRQLTQDCELSFRYIFHEDLIAARKRPLDFSHAPDGNRPAVIQFTSGSTGVPKGIELTMDMIEQNCNAIAIALEINTESRLYNWMPFFHDFGLIFGVFLPTFLGCRICIVDTMAFVQNPNSCFRGIEANAITHAAFASFALEHCVVHADSQTLTGLNLSRLQKLVVGADFINIAHAEKFLRVFAPYGFATECLVTGYGLAEGTLAVTIGSGGIQSHALRDQVWQHTFSDSEIISCGKPIEGVELKIRSINRNCKILQDGDIGEILISGPSVISHYSGHDLDCTSLTILGRTYFPTGDIGFIVNGELFVCGRLKEILIVNGENISPNLIEDICLTTLGLHRVRHQVCAYVFNEHGMNRLGIAIEATDILRNSSESATKISKAVFAATDLPLSRIDFFRKGTLPKTSSGKLMRRQIALDQSNIVHGETGTRFQEIVNTYQSSNEKLDCESKD